MADDQLNVSIRADVSQLSQGMTNAATVTKQAANSITESFNQCDASALKLMQDLMRTGQSAAQAAETLKANGVAAQTVANAYAVLGAEIQGVVAPADEAAVALTGMDRAMATATGRAAGMALGMGGLGSALGRVGAASSTIGPIMQSLFPIVLIGAAIDLLAKIPDMIGEITDKFVGWDKAAKQTYEDVVSGNLRLMVSNARLADQIQDLNTIGHTGSEKYRIAIEDNVQSVKRWADVNADLLHQQHDIEAQIAALKNSAPATVPGAQAMHDWLFRTNQDVDRLNKQLREVVTAETEVTNKIKELSKVQGPKLGAEQSDAQRKEAEKAAEEQVRIEQRLAEEHRRQILAGLNEDERAAKEHIKILEEEVRENEKAAKSIESEEEKAAKGIEKAYHDAWEAVIKEQNKANREHEAATRKMQQQWNQMFAPINQGIDRMVDEFLRGNVQIGAIFRDMGMSMLKPILTSFEKAIEAQIEYNLTAGALGKEHALASIMRDAYKAAANVYAEVPFPFNIPAAAGVFAAVVALGGGLPSAAGGMWQVPNDMLAMVHKDESILPSGIASGLRDMVGKGSGGNTYNYQPTISASGSDLSSVIHKSGKQFFQLARREMRRQNR